MQHPACDNSELCFDYECTITIMNDLIFLFLEINKRERPSTPHRTLIPIVAMYAVVSSPLGATSGNSPHFERTSNDSVSGWKI